MIAKGTFRAVEEDAFKIDWVPFFAPETDVIALPGWDAPRLFISAEHPMQRWRQGGFYPAFRLRARALRLGLRVWATLGFAPGKVTPAHEWTLGSFVREVLPQVDSIAVRPGWPGPERKITVQCRDIRGRVVGYLKYAALTPARTRLRNEYEMLSHLPTNLGPTLLKYGPWHEGEALLTAPLQGRTLPTTLPPSERVVEFVQHLVVGKKRFPLEAHPWVQHFAFPDVLTSALEALKSRMWPIAIKHGDLTPWNMYRKANGTMQAFDWEHGTLCGFPYLDLAHYVLQVADLVKNWPPAKARRRATRCLTCLQLSPDEAEALVRLSAYDAYRIAREDGHGTDVDFQQFRRAIWEDGI